MIKFLRVCSVLACAAVFAASLTACNKKSASSSSSEIAHGSVSAPITGVDVYLVNQPELYEGALLDYSLLEMEYSVQRSGEEPGQFAEPPTGEHMPLTMEMVQAEPGAFALSPDNGTPLVAGTQTVTFSYTPAAGSQTFVASFSLNVLAAGGEEASSSSQPEEASSSSVPPVQPAPVFVENTPSVAVSGRTASVTYKTNVPSTINAILTTSPGSVKTAVFYDYFNRGKAFDGAVSKKQTMMVSTAGKTETYDLPDLSKSYYLLINAVENETGTWQSGVTAIQLYDAGTTATGLNGAPVREADVDGRAVFKIEALVPATVYAMVTPKDAPAPTAQQIKDSGSGYTGTISVVSTAKTNTDKAPYIMKVELAMSSLAKGNYTLWVTAMGDANTGAPLAAPAKLDFTLS